MVKTLKYQKSIGSSLVRIFPSHSYVPTCIDDVINTLIGNANDYRWNANEMQINASERKHATQKRKILLALFEAFIQGKCQAFKAMKSQLETGYHSRKSVDHDLYHPTGGTKRSAFDTNSRDMAVSTEVGPTGRRVWCAPPRRPRRTSRNLGWLWRHWEEGMVIV